MIWLLVVARTSAGTPAPSIGVVSQGTDPHHTLAVQRAVEESRYGMHRCYEIGLMSDPTLEAELVAVRPADTWSMQSSDLPDHLADCVLSSLEYAIVPAGAATVTLSFRLKVPPVGRVELVNVAGDAGLAAEVQETLPQQRDCYAGSLAHESVSPGDVRYRLVSYEAGGTSVELVEGTLTPDLKECMTMALQMHIYPAATGSAEVLYRLEIVE